MTFFSDLDVQTLTKCDEFIDINKYSIEMINENDITNKSSLLNIDAAIAPINDQTAQMKFVRTECIGDSLLSDLARFSYSQKNLYPKNTLTDWKVMLSFPMKSCHIPPMWYETIRASYLTLPSMDECIRSYSLKRSTSLHTFGSKVRLNSFQCFECSGSRTKMDWLSISKSCRGATVRILALEILTRVLPLNYFVI